jgi:Flp pilus assembly pilin Flp
LEEIDVLRNFFKHEEGQGLVEIVLIITLIAIVMIGIVTLLSRQPAQLPQP